MRHVSLLVTIGFCGVCFAAVTGACGDDGGELLTTVTSVGPGTGAGTPTGPGPGGSGGAGQGGAGGSTSDGGSTSQGGGGGSPPPECGDGNVDTAAPFDEECDDGNSTLGDGCDDDCEEEDGWDCGSASPSNCLINGCDPDTAADMTGMTGLTIALGDPDLLTYPYCAKIDMGTVVTVDSDGSTAVGATTIVGGSVAAGDVKTYHATSPIQPLCAEQGTDCGGGANGNCMADTSPCLKADPNQICCFDPNNGLNNCYTGGCWNMDRLGVLPFYSNFDPGNKKGAFFVEMP